MAFTWPRANKKQPRRGRMHTLRASASTSPARVMPKDMMSRVSTRATAVFSRSGALAAHGRRINSSSVCCLWDFSSGVSSTTVKMVSSIFLWANRHCTALGEWVLTGRRCQAGCIQRARNLIIDIAVHELILM
eukprot:1924609-Amphidinium_carterae.1